MYNILSYKDIIRGINRMKVSIFGTQKYDFIADNEPLAALCTVPRRTPPERSLVAPAEAYHTARLLSSSFRGINACNCKN